jgi:hypothetical protein
MQGRQPRSPTEIKKIINIKASGGDKFINRFIELMILPLAVTVFGAFITKLLGLT